VVIVAISPLLASRIHYAAALPARREQLMIRMPMGSVSNRTFHRTADRL